jgi:hypothetical protein
VINSLVSRKPKREIPAQIPAIAGTFGLVANASEPEQAYVKGLAQGSGFRR